MRTIDKIIVHCADTPNEREVDIAEIRRWHVARGWRDVGYHYVIRRDAEIEVGRMETDVGAHCYGQNSTSIGICLVGRDEFTREQLHSLRKLIEELSNRYNINEVTGHYKYSDKTCPNMNVEEWYSNERI